MPVLAHDEPLLERDRELERLLPLISAAAAGEGRLGMIEGAPGIGKTTLLTVLRQRGAEAGIAAATARGSELERAFSFGVVVQLFDPLVRRATGGERDAVFSGAAGLVQTLFDEAPTPGAGIPDADFATLHGFYWLLAGLAERSPLLLLVDDLHWIDRPSLRVLAFLAHRLEDLPVSMLVATRPDVPAEHRSLMAELASEVRTIVRPGALSRDAVAALLGASGEPEAALVDACHRVTGGNPFYVRAVLDEIEQEPLASTPAAIEQLSPRAVGLALLRRLHALAPGAAALAEATAVLGDGADREEARVLMDLERDAADQAAAALERAEILAPGDRLAFTHPIARAAIYGGLEERERSVLHARAATLRLRAGLRPDHVAAQLMLAPAGTVEGAPAILRTAAEYALDRGAPDGAAAYLRRALREPLDDERRADLAAMLGGAAARAGLPRAETELRQALELAPDAERRAAAALQLARLCSGMGRSPEAIDVLAECVDRCAGAPPGVLDRVRAEVLAIGDIDLTVRSRALRAAARFPGEPRHAGDSTVAAMLLAHRATDATMRCAPADEAAALALQALASGALISAGLAGVQLSFLAAYFLVCADRYAEAASFFERVIDGARQTGSAAAFASASAWRSFADWRRGDLAAAEADARAGVETARAIGLELIEHTALTMLCFTLLERGQAQQAARELEDAAIDPRAVGTLQGAAVLEARGRVRLALRDIAGGVDDLLESGRRVRETGLDNPTSFAWRSAAAPALAVLGRRDEAHRLAHEETVLARRWGAPRALGLALRVEGALSNDLALLEEAVATLTGSAATLEHARALIEFGAALRRLGRRVDARPRLHEGLELAQTCLAANDAARARTELRAAGGRARTPMRTGVDSLTPSEHRIAALAAQGRSNPEIAQDLFLTKKTIEMHLSAVYRKLAIRSRGDLGGVLVAT